MSVKYSKHYQRFEIITHAKRKEGQKNVYFHTAIQRTKLC